MESMQRTASSRADTHHAPWTMKRSISFTGESSISAHGHVHKPHTPTPSNDAAWDVEGTMAAMDRRYGTNFANWIQKEENLECTASHLRGILHEFESKRVC
jgi:hypothetical protein